MELTLQILDIPEAPYTQQKICTAVACIQEIKIHNISLGQSECQSASRLETWLVGLAVVK